MLVLVQFVKRTWILEPDVLGYLSPVWRWISCLCTLILSIARRGYYHLLYRFGGLDVTWRASTIPGIDTCSLHGAPLLYTPAWQWRTLGGITHPWHFFGAGCWDSWVASNWWVVFLSKCWRKWEWIFWNFQLDSHKAAYLPVNDLWWSWVLHLLT